MPSATAAKGATSTIPVVFETGIDPAAASLAPPLGNFTCVAMLTAPLMSKRLELLSELVERFRIVNML
jgi:putative ABC transport system substrate-binding protein